MSHSVIFLKIITTAEAGTGRNLGQGALATVRLRADASVARALAAEAGLLDNNGYNYVNSA